MSLQDITTLFSSLLNRSDMTTAQTTQFLQMGVQRAQRVLRIPSMERVAVTEVTTSATYSVIPNDFIELKEITVNGLPLKKLSYRQFLQLPQNFGTVPRNYCRLKDRFLIAPSVGAGGEIVVYYYGQFGPLVNPTDENELTLTAPDVLLYGALQYAGDFFDHDKRQEWEEKFEALCAELNTQAQEEEFSGGSMAVQAAYPLEPEFTCYPTY